MFAFILFYVIIFVSFLYFSSKKPNNFPPGPKWYPIVGSFPQFKILMNSTKDFSNTCEILSQRYKSNIIGLKLGAENVVIIVASPKLARQIFLDDIFLGRPDTFFNRLRTFGTTRGITSTTGKLWSVQRNFVVKHLHKVGYGKKTMEMKITSEIDKIMKLIDLNQIDIDFRKLLSNSTLNVLWTLVSGIQLESDDVRLKKLFNLLHKRSQAFDMSGGTLNYFPWLRYFAPKKLGYNLIKEINTELGEFFRVTIDQHECTWTEDRNDDLIYAYISEIKKNGGTDNYFNYKELQIVCLDLFFGGLTVTNSAMNFIFYAMMIHQDVQTKVQKILDEAFDRTKPLEYSDRNKVPYIEAVLREIARFYVTVPVIAPRAPVKDAILDGYKIPQGTSILISFNSLFTNSENFDKPEVFRPERFLDSNGKLISHEAYFPFGLGKRKCLGDDLAKMGQFMIFAEIIRNYKIYPLGGTVIGEEKSVPGMVKLKDKYPIKLIKRI